MKRRAEVFFAWWFCGTLAYGIIAGCIAVAFGLIGAWSFGMSGEIPILFHSRILFPTQIIMPLPESFDLPEVFLHSFASGIIYSAGLAGIIISLKRNENGA